MYIVHHLYTFVQHVNTFVFPMKDQYYAQHYTVGTALTLISVQVLCNFSSMLLLYVMQCG